MIAGFEKPGLPCFFCKQLVSQKKTIKADDVYT